MKNYKSKIELKTGHIGDTVDNLELSVRNANCLNNAYIKTIDQLDIIPDAILLKIPNMGRRSIKALRAEVDRYLNRAPTDKHSDKHNARHKLPKDPAFSRAWNAVEEMGGAETTAENVRNDWRCLLKHPMQGPKGAAHIMVALEFFGLLSCEEVMGPKPDRQWIEIEAVRKKFPELVPAPSN
jgi:hypothetical protein